MKSFGDCLNQKLQNPTKLKISSDDGHRKLTPQEANDRIVYLMEQRNTEIPDIDTEEAGKRFTKFLRERNNLINKKFAEHMEKNGYIPNLENHYCDVVVENIEKKAIDKLEEIKEN